MDAKMQLGIDHDKDDMYLYNRALEAEKKIGSFYQYERKREVIDINGCTACLPPDAVLVEIAVIGNQGEGCENLLDLYCGVGGITNTNLDGQANFLVVDVGGSIGETVTVGTPGFHVQNNKIIFNNDLDGQQVTVQYLRYKVDCHGFMEVGENHIEAIKWFIVWNWFMRDGGNHYVQRDKMIMARDEWERNCRSARADDSRMSPTERAEAARLYANPFTGRGLWQGMYTTLGNNYNIW